MTYLINGVNSRAGVRGGGPIGTYHIQGLGVDKDALAVGKTLAAGRAAGGDVSAFDEPFRLAVEARKRWSDKLAADRKAWDLVAGPIRNQLTKQAKAALSALKLPAGELTKMVESQVNAQLESQLKQRGLGPRPPADPYPKIPPLPVLPTLIVGQGASAQGEGFAPPEGEGSKTTMLLAAGGAALVALLLLKRRG
jgi:hypothetical protein